MLTAGNRTVDGSMVLLKDLVRPWAIVYALAALVWTGYLLHIMRSDIGYLAVVRLQDDSYYYLQPAWLFQRLHRFSFDGINLTYGFQPLWMIVLAAAAFVSPDRMSLLRLSLIIGASCYVGAGVVIYNVCRSLFRRSPWLGTIIPVFWISNINELQIFSSAKENGLYVLLLVLALASLYYWRAGEGGVGQATGFGLICSLMALTRVNALPFAVFLIAVVAVLDRRQTGEKTGWRSRSLLTLTSFALPLVAWGKYAYVSFGTLLPTSGTVKLLTRPAAITYWFTSTLRIPAVMGWLPLFDRLLATKPETLDVPHINNLVSYIVVVVPTLIWRFVLGSRYVESHLFVMIPVWIAAFVVLVCGVPFVVCVACGRKFEQSLVVHRCRVVCGVLLMIAFANSTLNWLLFHNLKYTTWYPVPEMVLDTVLAGGLLAAGVYALTTLWKRRVFTVRSLRPMFTTLIGGCVVVEIGAVLLVRGYLELEPRRYTADNIQQKLWQNSAYTTAQWIEQHVPPGNRIGSWSSGLFGYFLPHHVVVNLDGLANSPGYAQTIMPNFLLYQRNLTPDNLMWEYIKGHQIRYIVDAWSDDQAGQGPFYFVIPSNAYDLVYASPERFYDNVRGFQRTYVLALRY